MIDDAFKSIKAYLYERNSSPLLGSFVTSWLIWNYKILFLLFSDLKYNEKVAEIEMFYRSVEIRELFGLAQWELTNYVSLGIVFPLMTAVFYLFIFPWPARWVYHFSLWQQRLTANLKRTVEGKQLLTVEEARKLRMELAGAEKELTDSFERTLRKKDREIELLKVEISNLGNGGTEKDNQLENIEENVESMTNSEIDEESNPSKEESDDSVEIKWTVDSETEKLLQSNKPIKPSTEYAGGEYEHNADEYRASILTYIFTSDQPTRFILYGLLPSSKLVDYYIEYLMQEGLVSETSILMLSQEGKDEAVSYLNNTASAFKRNIDLSKFTNIKPQIPQQPMMPLQPVPPMKR